MTSSRPSSNTYPSASPGDGADSKTAEAKDRATDVAQTGKQAATDVAQTAGDAARDVASQTKEQASDLLGKTRDQLTEQVGVQQSALVETLRSFGDQCASMTDKTEQDGTAVDLVTKARDGARDAASWLDSHDGNEVLDEVRRFGRERPGAFLLGAAIAGVVAGRLTRGAVAVHTDDSSSGPSLSSGTPSAGTPAPAPRPVTGRHEALTRPQPDLRSTP